MVTTRLTGAAAPAVETRGGFPALRATVSFVVVLVGLVGLAVLFRAAGWSWLLYPAIGLIAGAVAGRAAFVWIALMAVVVYHATAIGLDLPRDPGSYWYIAAGTNALLLAAAFIVGVDVGWRRPPLAAASDGWRALGRWPRRLLVLAVVVAIAGLVGYGGVVLSIGPDGFMHPERSAECSTPATLYGWDYQAINYDKAGDAALASNASMTKCTTFGSTAGSEVVTSDGIKLAGWYVPAASATGPSGPTVVIVHGWAANKSGALPFAPGLHQDYNLVMFDLRNSGQSSGDTSTLGLYEQRDLSRMIDWLVATKNPSWIGVVGNSMGAATSLATAVNDTRIKALVLDSMHADVVTTTDNAMEEDRHYPGGPAAWLIVTGVGLQLGGDISSIDPVRLIGRLGERPVLLTAGAQDQVDTPAEATERNVRAAVDAGVPVEVTYCQGARHGKVIEVCPTEWASWASSFFAMARAR